MTVGGQTVEAKATGSPSTAPPARSSPASSRPIPARSCRCSSRRASMPTRRTPTSFYERIMAWADEFRRLRVRANADQPDQVGQRRRLRRRGHRPVPHRAHVLRRATASPPVREMILAETRKAARAALAKLLPMQREDFVGIFRAMGERPVTIRTARPAAARVPAPHRRGAGRGGRSSSGVSRRGDRDQGRRRCTSSTRCSATAAAGSASPTRRSPSMQARAILEAACAVKKEGVEVQPEIMIPLVGHARPSSPHQAGHVREVAAEVFAEAGRRGRLPGRHDDRAAAGGADRRRDRRGGRVLLLRHQRPDPDDLRLSAATTPASSCRTTSRGARDLAGRPVRSPSTRTASGQLVEIGVEKGRATRPGLKVGICGEHGGEPVLGEVLPPGRPGLRVLLAVPRPDRAAGGGAGGARGDAGAAGRQVSDCR